MRKDEGLGGGHMFCSKLPEMASIMPKSMQKLFAVLAEVDLESCKFTKLLKVFLSIFLVADNLCPLIYSALFPHPHPTASFKLQAISNFRSRWTSKKIEKKII